jgi:glycosyltransferase involved in cell wall biosynthesis
VKPLVSVLIPARDAAPWVADAIRSALDQTWPRVEVVALDDGSRDDTPKALASFGARIRWESTPPRGANAARNRLLELARGEWLQYLDADDVLFPRKLERQMEAALRAEADLVVSPCLNETGMRRHVPASADPWTAFLRGGMGVTTSNLFRSAALVEAGGWDPALRAGQEQNALQAMLARGARVAFVSDALCVKRHVNPDSLWRRIWRDDPDGARRANTAAVAAAVRHLRQRGELTPEREAAAGARFLLMAQGARGRHADRFGSVLAEARDLGLGPEALLSASPRWYRALARGAGLGAAEAVRVRLRARRELRES